MKQKKTVTLLLAILLFAFALLSLGDCFLEIKTPGPWGLNSDTHVTENTVGYLPTTACLISGLELLLLLPRPKKSLRFLGLGLTVCKIFLPIIQMAVQNQLDQVIMDVPSLRVSLLPLSYVLWGIGAASVLVYICSILGIRRPEHSEAPEEHTAPEFAIPGRQP